MYRRRPRRKQRRQPQHGGQRPRYPRPARRLDRTPQCHQRHHGERKPAPEQRPFGDWPACVHLRGRMQLCEHLFRCRRVVVHWLRRSGGSKFGIPSSIGNVSGHFAQKSEPCWTSSSVSTVARSSRSPLQTGQHRISRSDLRMGAHRTIASRQRRMAVAVAGVTISSWPTPLRFHPTSPPPVATAGAK